MFADCMYVQQFVRCISDKLLQAGRTFNRQHSFNHSLETINQPLNVPCLYVVVVLPETC